VTKRLLAAQKFSASCRHYCFELPVDILTVVKLSNANESTTEATDMFQFLSKICIYVITHGVTI